MIDISHNSLSEMVYHFDLPSHSLPLKQFIDTARASQSILDDFNDKIFDKKVKFEIHVLPAEQGGFIEILSIVVIGGGGTLWGMLGTDIGKAYFRGLTGKEPAEWAETLGKKQRKWLDNRKKIADASSAIEQVADGELISDSERDAAALVEFLVSFLAANMDKLQQVGLTPEKFRKAFQAKNTIYKSCIDNPDIQGLGFDRSHDFPIKRDGFPRLITQMPDQIDTENDAPMSWMVETVDIVVNSPNWKRDGRNWQAATEKHQDISFTIEDSSFWHHVQIKDIQPDIRDNLRVQWAYPAGLSKPSKNVRVLRVLSYNGTKISDAMSQADLSRELEEATVIEPETPDLFDEKINNKNEGND